MAAIVFIIIIKTTFGSILDIINAFPVNTFAERQKAFYLESLRSSRMHLHKRLHMQSHDNFTSRCFCFGLQSDVFGGRDATMLTLSYTQQPQILLLSSPLRTSLKCHSSAKFLIVSFVT